MSTQSERLQKLRELRDPSAAILSHIQMVKGEKGDQGPQGPAGRNGVDGQSIVGPRGVKGDQGPKGDRGPAGINGKDGVDGKDGRNGLSPSVENIIRELKKLPIAYKDIKDAPDLTDLPKLIQFLKTGGFRGGGDTVAAGTGVTISVSNGVKTINSTGGGGSGYQAPLSGGLTGTNTWATAPNVLVIDGVPRRKVQTDGTIMWTGTTTTVLTNAPLPTFDIFGL